MKPKFVELELVLYLVALVFIGAGITALGLWPQIFFQARQDPTFIIYTIFVLFIAASVWVVWELIWVIREHGKINKLLPRLNQFFALTFSPEEQKSMFGRILIGLRVAHQQNPLHDIDYRAEIAETVAVADTRHATIRFMARVSQYLGVVGTMLGLIIALGVLYRDLSIEQQDLQAQIIDAIKNSMSGMYAAYATSVAGLFLGSIVLTFGGMLLTNALNKIELRLLVITRRFIAPQLGLSLNPADAEGKSFDVLVRSLQGVLEQFQRLHQSSESHIQATRDNNDRLDRLIEQQGQLQQQFSVIGLFMERLAVFASRAMGVPMQRPDTQDANPKQRKQKQGDVSGQTQQPPTYFGPSQGVPGPNSAPGQDDPPDGKQT